jgi:hypothetical protein
LIRPDEIQPFSEITMGPNLTDHAAGNVGWVERRDRLFDRQLVILDSSLGFSDGTSRWSEWFANNRVGEL